MVRFAVLLTLFGFKKHIGGHRYFSIVEWLVAPWKEWLECQQFAIWIFLNRRRNQKGIDVHGSDKYSFTC